MRGLQNPLLGGSFENTLCFIPCRLCNHREFLWELHHTPNLSLNHQVWQRLTGIWQRAHTIFSLNQIGSKCCLGWLRVQLEEEVQADWRLHGDIWDSNEFGLALRLENSFELKCMIQALIELKTVSTFLLAVASGLRLIPLMHTGPSAGSWCQGQRWGTRGSYGVKV